MPGVHKSPLYKGIGKYKKKAKGKRGFKMTSPLKKNTVDFTDEKVKENYEKYKDNPDYRKALDAAMGGKTNYDPNTKKSTTVRG